MKTPNKPLFIIDSSRSHGRGRETEWISCTSSELPFVGMGTIVTEEEYHQEYDKTNNLVIYSDNRGGFRFKIEVTNISKDYNTTVLRTLLRKGLKEVLTRHKYQGVDISNVTNENCLYLVNEFLKQNTENLRENPTDKTAIMIRGILTKMKNDYEGR